MVDEKGVAKSQCADNCNYLMFGSEPRDKVNLDTSSRMLKNLSSLTTFLYIIEDNASANKEENLAVSSFDTEKKDGDSPIVSLFIFTTNTMLR